MAFMPWAAHVLQWRVQSEAMPRGGANRKKLAPVTSLTLTGSFPKVRPPALGTIGFHGVTGGVYKTRERIHRVVADTRLLAIPTSCGRVADHNPN